jgi:hypothetical protein
MEDVPVFRLIEYETERYGFRPWAETALGLSDLAHLHRGTPFAPIRPNDRVLRARWNTALTRKLPDLEAALARFIASELPRHFEGPPEVRHPPMFRIHPAGWESISPFHRDSAYGLAAGAINVWIPLTPVWDSNSLWVESAPGRGDFQPVALAYGQALLFDAVALTHGSRANATDSTRVSFDFRCHGWTR